MKKPVIFITGPTASGKTKSSVLLAQKINGEIISADSMQVYRGMDIGTAKIRQEEMEGIPHYMIDELEPSEGCNVSWFKDKVKGYIDMIHAKGKIPILVGGTGFYLNAVLFDTTFEEVAQDTRYRESLQAFAKQKGPDAIHEMLAAVDPASAQAIHANNVKRVIRALEYYEQTGTPISLHNAVQKEKRLEDTSPYDYTFFALEMARETLYKRIDLRVDQMVQEGVVEEVRQFYDQGFTTSMPSMKAIGYKEFFPYFEGQAALDDCVNKLKQSTRQYAKRQVTWLRHQANPIFVPVDTLAFDAVRIVDYMMTYLVKK